MQQEVKKEAEEKAQAFEENKGEIVKDYELSPEMQARLEALEEKEKKLEVKIDIVADKVAEKMGYRSLPWLKATWFLLWIYTVLTILVLIQRSDFINLTICVTALYMLFNT